MRLAASRVHIPGKQAVGIEVPNKRRTIVSLRETISDAAFLDNDRGLPIALGEADPLFDKALDIVIAAGKSSTSYVQRKLKIGYNRAARLVEELEVLCPVDIIDIE